MVAGLVVAGVAGGGADEEPAQVAADGGRVDDVLPFAETTPSTERVTASTATSQATTTTTAPPTTTTTAAPTTTTTAPPPPPPPTTIAPQPATSSCDPNYDPCVPNVAYDLDCGDIGFRVRVIGGDPHGFDREGDGIGCESY